MRWFLLAGGIYSILVIGVSLYGLFVSEERDA